MSPLTGHELQVPIQRELLREQQRVSHERIMRRLKQRQAALALRAEHDFQKSCDMHDTEAKRYVPAVKEYLKLRDEENARKAAAPCGSALILALLRHLWT